MVLDRSTRDPNSTKLFATYADAREFAAHASSFETFAGATWAQGMSILAGRGPAKAVMSNPVTVDFFRTLGVSAAIGRTFINADLTRGCSIVTSDAFWRETLGADPAITGRAITLDQRSCTILGVMRASFEFYPRQTQMWALVTPDTPEFTDRSLMAGVGRLKRGITPAQAQSELASLHQAIHRGDQERDVTPSIDRLQDEFSFLAGRNLRLTLWTLWAAVAAILLIACINIANLLLGRLTARERELAVRSALGAGRARLIRQLLLEAAVLAIPGALLGVGMAKLALIYFRHVNPIELPIGSDISIRLSVLGFTAALSIASVFLFALAPAILASRRDPGFMLGGAGRGVVSSGGLAQWLVAAEMALCLALVASSGLLIRSVVNMASTPLGFDPNDLYRIDAAVPLDRYPDRARMMEFFETLRRGVNALPGVQGALSSFPPPYGMGSGPLEVAGQPRSEVYDTGLNQVSPEYFGVMRVALLSGRTFDERDSAGSENVAVVNEALVRAHFNGENPIGRQVRRKEKDPWLRIVGVVADEKRQDLFHEMTWRAQPVVYRPVGQTTEFGVTVLIRSRGGIGPAIHQAVAKIDPGVALGSPTPMRGVLGSLLKYPAFRAVVVTAFSTLALLLASIGLCGVLAQFVAQRTREIGVRMAIGAGTPQIVKLIARRGGVPVMAGLAFGLAFTFGITRLLANLLYGVKPADPWTLFAGSLIMVIAAGAGVLYPMRRATRVDPMSALRSE